LEATKEYEFNQEIWIAGCDRFGNHTEKERKAIFKGYHKEDSNLCWIRFADVKFKKDGLDSSNCLCLTKKVTIRTNGQ